MKKIIFGFLMLCFLSISFFSFAYDLTDGDNDLLDKVENKLFTIIDENDSITPEIVVDKIDTILEKRNLSDRSRTLFEIIKDDTEYEYEIGYYAYEEQTPDDCYEDEYFDEEDRQCYYDEDNYDDSYEDDDYISDDYEINHDHESESPVLATYSIDGDEIMLISGSSEQVHTDLWNMFTTLIPTSARKDFLKYEISNDANSDTAAHVVQDEQEYTKWNMNVNLSAFYEGGELLREEAIATLIHEFTHVMTLSKAQMRYAPQTEDEGILQRFAENCTTNFVQEGCLHETAYLDDFIDTFWTDKDELEDARDEKDVYTGNESKYITDYAATNPGEDIAESFTYFVLRPKPTGNTLADQKLKFFYQYKKLDSLRKAIRSRLQEIK